MAENTSGNSLIQGRIYGIETEYGVYGQPLSYEQENIPSVEDCAKELFSNMPKANRTTNYFLANGGRLYLDIGSHPEYASAECSNLLDLVANDRAGEELLASMVTKANVSFAEKGVQAVIHLFKNNVDSVGNSYGCHENYLIKRSLDYDTTIKSLVNFFVTRQVITGAGHVQKNSQGQWQYMFSPRANCLSEVTSADTTRQRPIINTKDEPHGDKQKYRRMHVLSGDSNVCDVTTLVKFALTGLVLDYLESGGDFSEYNLADPIVALQAISEDFSATVQVELESGERMSAVQIQEGIIAKLQNHIDAKGGFTDADQYYVMGLEIAKDALEALKTRDFSKVDTKLDWAIKYKFLSHYIEQKNIGWDSPVIARLNLAYHDISTQYGLAHSMRKKGLMQQLVDFEQVSRATQEPPQNTRAKIRGDFIGKALSLGFDISVNWTEVRLNNPFRQGIELMDPFVNYNEQVADLMDELDQLQP